MEFPVHFRLRVHLEIKREVGKVDLNWKSMWHDQNIMMIMMSGNDGHNNCNDHDQGKLTMLIRIIRSAKDYTDLNPDHLVSDDYLALVRPRVLRRSVLHSEDPIWCSQPFKWSSGSSQWCRWWIMMGSFWQVDDSVIDQLNWNVFWIFVDIKIQSRTVLRLQCLWGLPYLGLGISRTLNLSSGKAWVEKP